MMTIVFMKASNQHMTNLTLNMKEYWTTLLNPIDLTFLKLIPAPKRNRTAGILTKKHSNATNIEH